LNYHLVSIPRREKVRLRVWLGGNDPVSIRWFRSGRRELAGAEIFDLFGDFFVLQGTRPAAHSASR